MFKGAINYRSDGVDIAFEAMNIHTYVQNTSGAIVAATAEAITLKVEVTNVDSIEEAMLAGADVADHVTKVLSFNLDRHFQRFNLVGHALVEEDVNTVSVQHLGNSIGFFMKMDSCLHLGPDKSAIVKSALEQSHPAGYLFYDQFRAALSLNDPLAQFMALYNIVLFLSNDSQENVDILAIQLDAATPTNAPFRPRRSGMQETVYTRLRNQIGHVRPGTTIDDTRAEMKVWLPGLIQMAKVLIGRQP